MTANPESVHREYLVDDASPHRMARAATRARMSSPTFIALIAIEALGGLLLVAAGPVWLGIACLAIAILFPILLVLQTRRLAHALVARGFRPGTTVSADWGAEAFVVTTPLAHATHFYRDVRSLKVRGSAVAIRMNAARLLVVLPADLVPAAVRGQPAAGPSAGRATAGPA